MREMFDYRKLKNSKTRKTPLIPRFGIYFEVAGRQFSYKQVSLIEALMNVAERGLSIKNLVKIRDEQLAEIQFPDKDSKKKTIDAEAKVVRSRKLK